MPTTQQKLNIPQSQAGGGSLPPQGNSNLPQQQQQQVVAPQQSNKPQSLAHIPLMSTTQTQNHVGQQLGQQPPQQLGQQQAHVHFILGEVCLGPRRPIMTRVSREISLFD